MAEWLGGWPVGRLGGRAARRWAAEWLGGWAVGRLGVWAAGRHSAKESLFKGFYLSPLAVGVFNKVIIFQGVFPFIPLAVGVF